MAQEFNVANVNTRFTTSGLSTVQSGINKLGLSVGKVAGLLGGLGLAFSAKNLATSLFQTTKKLEQMKMAITAVSKTAAEADATFERIKNWAEINPVNTDDAIAAFVRMRTAGVQNAEAAMTQIADLASVTSRNMADVASAVVTTEVEPLRNLGIQLDRTGKQAIIQFGEVKKAVSKDINSVRAGIIEVLQQAIPNAMERTKNSVTGSLNTMSGMWQKMQSDIMGWGTQSGGLFGSINKSLNEFRNSWQAWMDSADYKRFLEELRNALNSLMTALTGAAKTVAQITGFLWKHRDAVTTVIEVYAAYKVTMSASQLITTAMIGTTNTLTGAVVALTGSLGALIAEISAVAIPLTAMIMLIKEAGKGMDELRNKQSQKLFGGQTTAQLQEQKKLNEQQIKSNKALIASEESKKKGLLQLDSKEAARLKAENRRLNEENALIEKAISKNKQNEPVKTAAQAPTVEPIKAANIAKTGTGTGTGKSATEQLIERIDAQVKYANADISEQIARLEQARSKVAKYSEDWNKVTDKIKELKSTQSAANELQMQLANAEPYKKATASLDFYLEEQKKAQNITDDTINSYERLQRQKTAVSNTDNALSAVISQLNEKLSENWQNVNFVTAEFEKLGKMSGLTAAQLEQVTKAQKELNNAKDSKAVSNILYGVEIGALKAKDAMTELQATVTATMSAEGVKLEDYGKFSDQLKNQLAALGQVASQVVQPSMDMLQKQYETGVLTLPQYIAELERLKQSYAGIPAVITQISETMKQAQSTASSYGSRMSSIYGQMRKNVDELNSTAPERFCDSLARAITYGEDLGEAMKNLAGDIAYAITKMLIFQALFGKDGKGGMFGGWWSSLFGSGFHSGGIVGTDAPTFTRSLPLPKFHTGGIVGSDEELAILKKGEGVFTKGQMQALGNSINNKTQTQTVTEGGTQIGSMTVNINAIDTQSFASNLANNKAVIEGIIVKNVMSNGNVRRTLKTALA